jgi:5-enolpyruvylshikimate-3-phosphate synthase
MSGDESLSRRPMQRVITPLTAMGAQITSQNGRPPLRITGAESESDRLQNASRERASENLPAVRRFAG